MPRRGKLSVGGPFTAAIIVAGAAFCVVVSWPGYISYDSALQLLQGRTGSYNTWHPPVMAWMLGVADWAVPGAGLFMVFDAALLCAAMLALLWLRPKPSWAAVIVAALCVASPQFLIYQAIVWKDVLFADAAVAGFVSLACAEARWRDARARFAFIGAAIVLLVLAALARQNGAVVIVAGAAALAAMAWRDAHRFRDAVDYGLGGLIAAAVLFACISVALETRGDGGAGRISQIKALQLYDITGMVAAEPDLKLDRLRQSAPALERLIRSDGVRLYSPAISDSVVHAPVLQTALANTSERTLFDQWRELATGHVGLYLRVRAEIFRWVALTPDIGKCHPYYIGVSGPPDTLRQLGLDTRPRARDLALLRYGAMFVGTPVFSHAFFGVLALAALVILFVRRAPADIAIGFMLLSAFAFAATFFAISLACDYRYLYYLDLSALVAAFYLSLGPFNARAYRA